jgi:ADP-ribose pyrophosphatase YjhB (NUDIX family)
LNGATAPLDSLLESGSFLSPQCDKFAGRLSLLSTVLSLQVRDYLSSIINRQSLYGGMPKTPRKISTLRPTKEVSVMAWIEESANGVLLVRQRAGLKLWTLPGGKVKRGESLVQALKREVREETGLRVRVGSLLGVLDRRDKDAVTLLFAAIPNKTSVKIKQGNKEIKGASFQTSLPKNSSPSAKYFWLARKGPVKKTPKIPASTHQFPRVW